MSDLPLFPPFASLLQRPPQAIARIQGDPSHPALHGVVRFYQTRYGVVVNAQLRGLPTTEDACRQPVFGFHIHSGGACSGNPEDPFADAGSHYNPGSCDHPYHVGDLPPLFGCDGMAFSVFLTDRFRLQEVLGRAMILHAQPDDFTTQPAGMAGARIACGIIRPVRPRR